MMVTSFDPSTNKIELKVICGDTGQFYQQGAQVTSMMRKENHLKSGGGESVMGCGHVRFGAWS